MVLNFRLSLKKALQQVGYTGTYQSFPIHTPKEPRALQNTDDILETYRNATWALVEKLNQQYGNITQLKNWLEDNTQDEVAYFLNEAGSNVLSYSEFKAPAQFHLWLGKKGFVIGLEQRGKGFNAKDIDQKRMKTNDGAAFDFFRTAKNVIFFDEAKEGRVVFIQVKVER